MLSPPKQIPIQSLPCKMTTCLMQPATTFFVSLMKKKKNLPSKEMKKKKTKQQCKKNKDLSDNIYSSANLQCRVCLMSIKLDNL